MKKIIFLAGTALLLNACSTVPLTGRKQLSLVSNSEVLSLSAQSYADYMKQTPLSKDVAGTAAVKRVGTRIKTAVEAYLKQTNQLSLIDGYQWEFNLVQSKDVNAFCMPGGKVVFDDGIMPLTKNDAGIAAVMGHEIAHAIAKHSNERMSQQLLVQTGTGITSLLLNGKSQETQTLVNTAVGLGANYGVLLPFSRKHESEADQMGLIFMAMAGYDPHEAVSFWERMAANNTTSVPEFMSTHPSDQTRIADLKKQLPGALKYYKKY